MSTITAQFKAEKVTKNTVRFQEVLADATFDVPLIGTVYVPKTTLAKLGWKADEPMLITLTRDVK